MKTNFIAWFEEVGKKDVEIVGGKGANLGEMLSAKFPIPYGFVVTAEAYFYFIEKSGLEKEIKTIISTIEYEDQKKLNDAGNKIRNLILSKPIPKDLSDAILADYNRLFSHKDEVFSKLFGKKYEKLDTHKNELPLVAVRSSATAEDLPSASFAGQQETYLNITGENDLLMAVRKCWASLFTDRAIYYREQQGFANKKVGLAAVVQLMVQSDTSGVAFSIDPVTNNRDVITIEAIYGLGEYIVQGKVTPDHYEVEKKTLKVLKKQIKQQEASFVKSGKSNKEVILTKTTGGGQKLSDDHIKEVAVLVRDIEKHYKVPQDIEWAVEGNQVSIVQARPITTVDASDTDGKAQIDHPALGLVGDEKNLILRCDPASPGVATGTPRVLKSPEENDKVKKGDILVVAYTSPDYVPAMKRAVAIVAEMGGRTSHAAIVSRELGIPAVVGAAGATKLFKNMKSITVNGSRGEVFEGDPYTSLDREKLEKAQSIASTIKTKTKVYVNLAQPESADRVAKMNVDGIGLLRAEFIVAHIGIHPKYAIEKGQQKHYIDELTKKLIMFVKPFGKRPVVYRATDFRTNEYRHLKGGEKYEPHEENPMIGYRGASRYIKDADVFAMEIEAIKKVRRQYKNLHLMIPFVRIPEEIRDIRALLIKNGLKQSKDFKLWMMVEVPSSAIMVEEFIKEGIDGISIGTNDLTMLILGVDRDNQEIAYIYDERRSPVLWALKRVIDAG
ncbi:MAG: phosphoenolpyruvate synthase, partial [Candidatus Roizmanbacteria bacterium]